MLLQYTHTEKANTILNDLLKINNDRIACYEQALSQSVNIDSELKDVFKEIIKDSEYFKEQLLEKIIEPATGGSSNNISISGLIHKAWLELKVTFVGNTRSNLISFCEYHEEVAQQAYRAALNASGELSAEVRKMIELQQHALKQTLSGIKKSRETKHAMHTHLMYFN